MKLMPPVETCRRCYCRDYSVRQGRMVCQNEDAIDARKEEFRRVLDDGIGGDFPEWCPLPDAPETMEVKP